MKTYQTYKVYVTDAYGSERLGTTVDAKSVEHARQIAKGQGIKKISSVELAS